MSHDKFQQLVGSLVKSLDDSERLATPLLAAKLARAVDAYPGDQTLGSMSIVIGKMAENNTLFISKGELKTLYNKLYSRNTKFAELFQEELGLVDPLQGATTYPRDEAVNINPYHVGDQVLANALQSVFDKTVPVKMYSQPLADKAKFSVGSTLDAWNLKPSNLVVDDGNDKFIVIRADYETPKGITSFYVPVELHKNKVAEPTVFMGNSGPQELNHTSLKAYLTTFTGNKLNINGAAILQVLTAASTEQREVSDAEVALTKLNAERQGKSEFFQGQVVGLKVEAAAKQDVKLPKSDEFASFEKQFASPRGQAEFKFGAAAVDTGRLHIVRELLGFGHKNPQVVVQDSDANTIMYSVALDAGRVGFSVPVKVQDKKVVKPTLMLCSGSVRSFSPEGINELYVNNYSDYKAAASASPQFQLKSADLIESIRKAASEGNHVQAEDALNVLAHNGDEKAYAAGFQLFMQGLSGQAQEAPKTQCSKMIKSAVSEHPICSHTGLPVHKVYQDKDGNCRPLFRRGMDETYEGAVFNNSKIFG